MRIKRQRDRDIARSCSSIEDSMATPVDEPPAKRFALSTKYRWCPHCNLQVAERTYRSHRALYLSQSEGSEQCVNESTLQLETGSDVSIDLAQDCCMLQLTEIVLAIASFIIIDSSWKSPMCSW